MGSWMVMSSVVGGYTWGEVGDAEMLLMLLLAEVEPGLGQALVSGG